MAAPPSTPVTLAQLHVQRRRQAGRAEEPAVPLPDRTGQFGLLFTEPRREPEPAAGPTLEPPLQPALKSKTEPEQSVPAPRRDERKLWSVAELVGALRGKVEREFTDVWVEGEISNCRPASSGHLYFTLKDGDAQLPAVLFRRQASLLRFRPQDGLAVLLRGRVSVFESRGQLQLIAETLEPRGAGALQLAFEQLKAKLRAEGLFDSGRKRPLPAFPRTIGVITSRGGAVLRDIATVCRRRHACLNLLVFPATVQGPTCAADVARGLRYFNATAKYPVDIIVIARGGGSAEDLAGFNDEAMARAIAASKIPVVSAIGHETDFTIADFVADLRAPTPSAAAELVTAAQHRLEERVESLHARLLRGMRFQQMRARERFARVANTAAFARMRDSIGRRQQRVDERRFRMEAAGVALLQKRAARLRLLADRLQQQEVRRRLLLSRARNESLLARLQGAGLRLLQPPRQQAARAEARLHSLSPTAVLQRGYALAFRADGSLLRSADEVSAGDEITTRLAQGAVRSRVIAPLAAPHTQTPRKEDTEAA